MGSTTIDIQTSQDSQIIHLIGPENANLNMLQFQLMMGGFIRFKIDRKIKILNDSQLDDLSLGHLDLNWVGSSFIYFQFDI